MTRYAAPTFAVLAQAALQAIWHGWLHPPAPERPALAVLAVLIAWLPLLALVPAARHSARRAALVGGIVSLLYFCHGVMEAWSNPAVRGLAALEIGFAIIAIFGLRRRTDAT